MRELLEKERESVQLVQAYHGNEWVAIQLAQGMPAPVIMPIDKRDACYEEWKQEVQCFCVLSRKPEHKHITFPEPPPHYPLPKDYEPTPIRTHCVFWYHDTSLILDAVELLEISFKGSAIEEILKRLKALEQG